MPSVGNYELAKADGKVTIGARGKLGYYKWNWVAWIYDKIILLKFYYIQFEYFIIYFSN